MRPRIRGGSGKAKRGRIAPDVRTESRRMFGVREREAELRRRETERVRELGGKGGRSLRAQMKLNSLR